MSGRLFPETPFPAGGSPGSSAAEYISIYVELRNAYLHSLDTNRSLRTSLSELSRDYHQLLQKYNTLRIDHDMLLDDHVSDI